MMRISILLAVLILWGAPALAYTFPHADHLLYLEGEPCTTCHVEGAKSIVPDRSVCLDCHDQDMVDEIEFPGLKTHGPTWSLTHRPYAKSNTPYDCASCHQQSDCLNCHRVGRADEMGVFGNHMLNVHRSDFHVTHPIAARTDQQLCASCHESRFCSDCHNEFRAGRAGGPSHRRTFDLGLNSDFGQVTQIHQNLPPGFSCENCHTAGTVVGDIHTWSAAHGREARKNLATCQSCHPNADVCIKCHSDRGGVLGANPHGKGWSDRAGRLDRASGGKTCRQCHDTW